ncbi:hypothetical protein NXV13_02160 [Bacteroides ovatus]|nr:hypothetical protein [Bacteroides ovatus]
MDKETEDKIMKATDIMHPEDAKAIQMIKSVPGCEQLIRVFMKLGYEAQYRGENLYQSHQSDTKEFFRNLSFV